MKTKHKQLININTTVRTVSVSSNWGDQRLIPVLTIFIEVIFGEFLDIFGADPLKYSQRWSIFASWGQVLFWEREQKANQSKVTQVITDSSHFQSRSKPSYESQHGTLMLLCKLLLAMKTISGESSGHQTLWLDS